MEWNKRQIKKYTPDEVEDRVRKQDVLILDFMNLEKSPQYKKLIKSMVHTTKNTYKPKIISCKIKQVLVLASKKDETRNILSRLQIFSLRYLYSLRQDYKWNVAFMGNQVFH